VVWNFWQDRLSLPDQETRAEPDIKIEKERINEYCWSDFFVTNVNYLTRNI